MHACMLLPVAIGLDQRTLNGIGLLGFDCFDCYFEILAGWFIPGQLPIPSVADRSSSSGLVLIYYSPPREEELSSA